MLSFSLISCTEQEPEQVLDSYKIDLNWRTNQPYIVSSNVSVAFALFDYYKVDISTSPKSIEKQVVSNISIMNNNIKITVPSELCSVMTNNGLRMEEHVSLTLNDIKRFISNEKLPIVILRNDQLEWSYVIVTGYNKNEIRFYDPILTTEIFLSNQNFKNSWNFTHDFSGNILDKDIAIQAGNKANIKPRMAIVPDISN